MMKLILEFLKTCGIKQLSINAIILIILSIVIIAYAGDNRYMLKEEGQQIQQYQMDELDDKLFVMKMRKQGRTQAEIDELMQDRWQKRFDAMEKASKGGK